MEEFAYGMVLYLGFLAGLALVLFVLQWVWGRGVETWYETWYKLTHRRPVGKTDRAYLWHLRRAERRSR